MFDAAGTLIEPVESVGETYARIARPHGVDLPAWRLNDAFGRVFRGMPPMCFEDEVLARIPSLERNWWQELVRRTLLATDSTARFAHFDAYFEALWDHFSASSSWQIRPGGLDTLRSLRTTGTRLGIVSNFDLRLPKILEELDIKQFFECIILPGTHQIAKPDPRCFDPALEALGSTAAETVYVGDRTEIDGVAATAAGLRFVDASQFDSLARLSDVLG